MPRQQQCSIAAIYFSWLAFAAGAGFFLLRREWIGAAAYLAAFPLALWAGTRAFPRISARLGYGRVADEPAAAPPAQAPRPQVVLYTALGCPFCPIVRDRLRVLSGEWGFRLEEVDVTAHPELLRARHIRAVPVIEVGGRTHVGAATTRELAELILGPPAPAPADPVPAETA